MQGSIWVSLYKPSLQFTVGHTVIRIKRAVIDCQHHSQLFITFCERQWPKMRLGKTCGSHYSLCILVPEQINVQKWFYIIPVHNSSLSLFMLLSTERERGKWKERVRGRDAKSTSLLLLSPLLRGRSLHLIHQSAARYNMLNGNCIPAWSRHCTYQHCHQ